MAINKEIIPDADTLFMNIHIGMLKGGDLHPGVFRDHEGGMSTNWSKYADAEKCRELARNSMLNGVIQMNVGAVREIPEQLVDHDPKPDNQAHTNVVGEKTVRARLAFHRISTWAINPPEDDAVL